MTSDYDREGAFRVSRVVLSFPKGVPTEVEIPA